MKDIPVQEKLRLPVFGEFDVAVAGGGVAGCAAALAAVRNGKKTLLIEKQTILGGLATSRHVVIYLPLCDGYGNQVIAGIAEELLYDSVKYAYGDDNSQWQGRKRYETRFNGPAFALSLERKLLDEGISLMYDTLFAGAIIEAKQCRGLIVENKSGRGVYLVKAVVDATGDAEVFARAGVPCRRSENSLAIWCYTTSDCGNILKRGSAPEKGLNLLTLPSVDKGKHGLQRPAKRLGSLSSLTYESKPASSASPSAWQDAVNSAGPDSEIKQAQTRPQDADGLSPIKSENNV